MQIDPHIIEGCRKGQKSSQRQLYDHFSSKWFTICLRYVHKREDAMDVMQNALVKIYTKLDQYDEKQGTFNSWSSRIMVNESIMFQRKYWDKREVSGLNFELMNDAKENDKALSNLGMEYLVSLIQTLPVGYRLVFNLYEIEGFTHKEVAAELGISEGTSKSQLFKAKSQLRSMIKKTKIEEVKLIASYYE